MRWLPTSDGAASMVRSARPGIIVVTLAHHAPIYALMLLPPGLWALFEGEMRLAASLCAPALAALALYIVIRRRALPSDLRAIEAMVTVALVFLIAVLVAVPGFMSLGLPLVDAVFEGMSGVTTTGMSMAGDMEGWPFSAHLLRAWMQWVGGLAMATAALALLLPAGAPSQRLGQAGIDQGDRIASTRWQARQLLGVYAGLTVLMTGLTILVLPDWRDALLLTLASISTGGFAPRPDSLAGYGLAVQGIVMLSAVLGAVSLLTFVLLAQGKAGEAWRLGSARRVAVALGVLTVAYGVVLLAAGERDVQAIASPILNLVSAMTGAGFATGPVPVSGAALVLFVIAMVIGGDIGSTSGGLKLARVTVMLRAVAHAIRAPALPDGAVAPLRRSGKAVDIDLLVNLLALLMIYLLATLLIWTHFMLHGFAPGPALFDTLSALSTVGLSAGPTGPDLPDDLKLSLSLAMWLGRLEFIAVLVLVLPRTWKQWS